MFALVRYLDVCTCALPGCLHLCVIWMFALVHYLDDCTCALAGSCLHLCVSWMFAAILFGGVRPLGKSSFCLYKVHSCVELRAQV
jgi:hypothetical protein